MHLSAKAWGIGRVMPLNVLVPEAAILISWHCRLIPAGGYEGFVDERSAVAVLNIVSRNESCKKPGFRVAAWFLVFLTFSVSLVLSGYQLWQAAQRISALST
jgi:hypothetical protein